jgi:hypothetical protein
MPATPRVHTRRILIAAAVLLGLGTGLLKSLGLFLTPITRDLGLTATSFPLAIAIQNIVWGGSSLGAWGGGVILDRFGSYGHAWQIGVLVGFGAGVVQMLAGGPPDRRERIAAPRFADAAD